VRSASVKYLYGFVEYENYDAGRFHFLVLDLYGSAIGFRYGLVS
jgi:hypothetical protein